jgi:hypothetical protein
MGHYHGSIGRRVRQAIHRNSRRISTRDNAFECRKAKTVRPDYGVRNDRRRARLAHPFGVAGGRLPSGWNNHGDRRGSDRVVRVFLLFPKADQQNPIRSGAAGVGSDNFNRWSDSPDAELAIGWLDRRDPQERSDRCTSLPSAVDHPFVHAPIVDLDWCACVYHETDGR